MKKYKIALVLLVAIICFVNNSIFVKAKDDEKKEVRIALVIDDFGYDAEGTKEMLDLSIPLTAAVMPFEVRSKEVSELAIKKGKEVIIHMPMEPNNGNKTLLDKKFITTNLSDEEIESKVKAAFEEVKGAKGLNNHMGSKATKDERVMRSVLKVVKDNNKFFLNSKTSDKTVAKDICTDLGIKYYERDVFLDHISTKENVEKSLEKAYDIAKEKGYAIAIGHVGGQGGKSTVNGIKSKIESLQRRGVRFVFLSEL